MTTLPKRPGKLWAVVVLGYLQAALNLLLMEASDRLDHGQEVLDGTYFAAVVSILVFLVVAVCGVLLLRGVSWARVPIAVVEGLSIVGALFTLMMVSTAGGEVDPSAFTGFAFPIGMLIMLFAGDVTEWFARVNESRWSAELGQPSAHRPPVDFPGIQ